MKTETKEIVEKISRVIAEVANSVASTAPVIINIIIIEHGGNWNFGKEKEGAK